MNKIKIVVAGCSGRIGRILLENVQQSDDLILHGALDHSSSRLVGKDAGELTGSPCGVNVTTDLASTLQGADVLIDFTRPEGTLHYLSFCQKLGIKMVIGTTGFNTEQKDQLRAASRNMGIVFSPNMSVGVNLTFKLLELAAGILNQGYDIEIIEAHHRHKVDAPSGTALGMGEVIAKTLGRNLNECAVYGRAGATDERDPSTIGFATIRGGDIVGDHTVLFAGTGERIEISHKASSRTPFALGALRAARFLQTRPAGMYDMQDVLGLK
jgi:4-hydroxy-tetrahydrodipicolinate reductase